MTHAAPVDADRAPSAEPRPAPSPPISAAIREVTVVIASASLGEEGLPQLLRGHETDLSAEDRLLIGDFPGHRPLDRPRSFLPYRSQNHYGREVAAREFAAVELSNEHLRATFLPELGGRLWSLVDLESGRDLLFQPDAVRFGNLALRDAWFSGGIEWNLGTTGHWGLTCTPVGAGIVEVDGQRILRMWALERLTGLVWRLEAWFPAGSRFLFTSARIANHTDADVPFYWWSNAAVPLTGSTRVLSPTATAFHSDYSERLERVTFPDMGDVDGSRPDAAPQAADYFFDSLGPDGVPAVHPWVAHRSDDGPGTLLASTPELPGKKLFVWGNTRGGRRWQDWLNGEGGRYVELQSGHSRTQREHTALAPGEVATWVEAFGPVTGPRPESYDDEVRAVARQVPEAAMHRARDVFGAAATTPPEVLRQPDGWGRVEIGAGHLPADPAVPFDAEPTEEQAAWLEVARGGAPDPSLARSPLVGPRWQSLLEAAPSNWVRDLLLGYCAWAAGDPAAAVSSWRASVAERPNAMALHCLAVSADDGWDAFDYAERAHEADPDNDDLLVEHLVLARSVPTLVLRRIDQLTPERQSLPRVRLALARALVAEGQLAGARAVIDGLELPNLRETSDELQALWTEYTAAAGVVDPLPRHLDFGMA